MAGQHLLQAARTGFAFQAFGHDFLNDRRFDLQFETLFFEFPGQAVHDVRFQYVGQGGRVQRLKRHEARKTRQQFGEEAVGLEIGHLLDLVGAVADRNCVGRAAAEGGAAEPDRIAGGTTACELVKTGKCPGGDKRHVGGRHQDVVVEAGMGQLKWHHHLGSFQHFEQLALHAQASDVLGGPGAGKHGVVLPGCDLVELVQAHDADGSQ